jgi:hypothetical protein
MLHPLTREHRKALVLDMCRKQGGFCTIAHIRRAAGARYGKPIATSLERDGLLLHVATDHYKLVTTKEEADMASLDVATRRKARRGRGSY